MIISERSQLGLMYRHRHVKAEYCRIMADSLKRIREKTLETLAALEGDSVTPEMMEYFVGEDEELSMDRVKDRVDEILAGQTLGQYTKLYTDDEPMQYFFICESVYKAASLIKMKGGFTSRTLKDVKIGRYTYLMGRQEMVRFECSVGVILGFYFNDLSKTAFTWTCDVETGEFAYQREYIAQFSRIMQLLTFIELGDIEVKVLEAGKKSGQPKGDKVVNTSRKTVYVVDSSWNQIVVRTDGFAVRGHFRLQPCGEGLRDRKLIWVDAFEKHGYKRRPKAEIAR